MKGFSTNQTNQLNHPNLRKSPFGRVILEMILLQIGALFLFFVLVSIIANFFSEQVYFLLSSVVCTILLMSLIYSTLWRTAERDYNMVKYNHITEDRLKGFKIGLYAVIPGGICVILAVLKRVVPELPDFFLVAYKLYFGYFIGFINILEPVSVFFYILPLLLPPLCSTFGYMNGYKHFRVFDKLIHKNRKKNPDSKKFR